MLLNIFLFFCLHPAACGILIPWPEIEPVPPTLEGRVLTTRSVRRSPLGHILQCIGQLPTTKNDLVPNVSSSKAKKSWPRGLRSSCVLLTYNDCHVVHRECVCKLHFWLENELNLMRRGESLKCEDVNQPLSAWHLPVQSFPQLSHGLLYLLIYMIPNILLCGFLQGEFPADWLHLLIFFQGFV